MKASDLIVDFLYEQGVRYVFELVGGMITHIVDSLNRQGKIQIISMHHEQAAGFAAEAVARMTGVLGVGMATSGPGATNMLTAIGSCYFDSYPAIFITGQVNRNEQKGNRPIRQLGFQETDIVAIASPITKAAWMVKSPEELPILLEKAIKLATSGRPGPVLLDIPMDIQRADIDIPVQSIGNDTNPLDQKIPEDFFHNLQQAERPLILAGGGIRSSRAVDQFRKFVNQVNIPVINSLMAVDTLPYDHPLRIGLVGSYGNRWVNLAVDRSDFLLVLGSRLDIRQAGSNPDAFKGNRLIYHVDCEPGEINSYVKGCFPIVMDLKDFFNKVNVIIADNPFPVRNEWLKDVAELRSTWPDTAESPGISGINPNEFMHLISKASIQAVSYVIDVGQHQMWAAQSLELGLNQRFLTSGGMGAMGYALPTAIGSAFASNRMPIVMIAGDGGFQVNIQELQTVVHHNLPIKMIIINNHCLGMVRQFQQSYFDSRYQSTFEGYSAPDFCKVAQAYGISSYDVKESKDIQRGLELLWEDPKTPFLLNVPIDTCANAYPKLAFGHTITEMEPFVKPIGMEGT